jgi:hypothetical protein
LFGHIVNRLQKHQPPAAIGSSSDGVAGGGKLLVVSHISARLIPRARFFARSGQVFISLDFSNNIA